MSLVFWLSWFIFFNWSSRWGLDLMWVKLLKIKNKLYSQQFKYCIDIKCVTNTLVALQLYKPSDTVYIYCNFVSMLHFLNQNYSKIINWLIDFRGRPKIKIHWIHFEEGSWFHYSIQIMIKFICIQFSGFIIFWSKSRSRKFF